MRQAAQLLPLLFTSVAFCQADKNSVRKAVEKQQIAGTRNEEVAATAARLRAARDVVVELSGACGP